MRTVDRRWETRKRKEPTMPKVSKYGTDHLTHGLPGNRCSCPHCGYVFKGRLVLQGP
jgi:hypothetical protein